MHRQIDIDNNLISNADGPSVWSRSEKNARTTPFPGSMRQAIASVNNDYGVAVNGPVLGGGRNFGGPDVRAPN